ncbi:MAG: DUF2141 domain-containing protein [Myxococcales bacterium]|nr:DUF2141 domain-containing protein [Myxococcales bacterium]
MWQRSIPPLLSLVLLVASDAAAAGAPASPSAAEPAPASAAEGAATLSIRLSGFRSDEGQVLIAVFRGEAGFPSAPTKAWRTAVTRVSSRSARLEIADVPPGAYAISVIHDENGNNELDTNFLGIPKEGIGTSNNAKGRMGPPKYRDAKFDVGDGDVVQAIKMVYL